MNDEQRKLLEDHKTIILPDEINHDAYRMVVEAATLYPNDEIDLYCRGEGGYSADAFAMIDIIQIHGQFIGLLLGAVVSSHAAIWASCAIRYVYPHGALGLHGVITTHEQCEFMDERALGQRQRSSAKINCDTAQLLADISSENIEYWLTRIKNTNLGLEWIYSDDVIHHGMAHPIADRKWVNGDNMEASLQHILTTKIGANHE